MTKKEVKGWYDLKDLEGETWQSCFGFDGSYEVSNLGRIKSLERLVKGSWGSSYMLKPRILKAAINKKKNKSKYYFVVLSLDGKQYTREVHKLVAHEFVSGDKSLMVIHKNHNTLDNRAVNLKYATVVEKSLQAWRLGNQVSTLSGKFGGESLSAKPITAFTMDGIKEKVFGSRIEAADWLINSGIARVQPKVNIMSAINKAAQGKTKSSYGYKWGNDNIFTNSLLSDALSHPLWNEHKIGDTYIMDGKPDLWKIAYYPIFEDGKTGQVYSEARALIEKPMLGGTDFREIPLRYLSKK